MYGVAVQTRSSGQSRGIGSDGRFQNISGTYERVNLEDFVDRRLRNLDYGKTSETYRINFTENERLVLQQGNNRQIFRQMLRDANLIE